VRARRIAALRATGLRCAASREKPRSSRSARDAASCARGELRPCMRPGSAARLPERTRGLRGAPARRRRRCPLRAFGPG
jgi:hypothetical protein